MTDRKNRRRAAAFALLATIFPAFGIGCAESDQYDLSPGTDASYLGLAGGYDLWCDAEITRSGCSHAYLSREANGEEEIQRGYATRIANGYDFTSTSGWSRVGSAKGLSPQAPYTHYF